MKRTMSSRLSWKRLAMIVIALSPFATKTILAQITAENVVVKQGQFAEGGMQGTRTTLTLSDGAVHAELTSDNANDLRLKPELRFNAWKGETRSYREDAALPVQQRLIYFRPLMTRLLATDGQKLRYGLLFYGYAELYERLPALAAKNASWNRRTGSPSAGKTEYAYLQQLINQGAAFHELAEAVSALGYEARIEGGMENLRVLPVSKLTEGQRRQLPPDIKATDLLPARISINFTLVKKAKEK